MYTALVPVKHILKNLVKIYGWVKAVQHPQSLRFKNVKCLAMATAIASTP